MRLRIYARTLAAVLAVLFILVIFFLNLIPFSVTFNESSSVPSDISQLTPNTRATYQVRGNTQIARQFGDYVYFKVKTLLKFDNSKAQVVFKNPSSQQEVQLGYQDQQQWHYNTSVLDAPFMNILNWPKLSGGGLYLYQKNPTYTSVNQFLKNPPPDQAIGTFDYDLASAENESVTIPGYQPAKQDTVINTPLRGSTTFYAYLNNEPFHLTVTKRDLNWYADPDVVNIKIYKDNDVVAQGVINDDGNASNNHVAGPPQSVTINNPGPGLPENGVYKVVIDAPSDTVITQIQTNLHKLAFAGPLYPVKNAKVYGGVASGTAPTTLYTDAPRVSAQTYHSAAQTVQVGPQGLPIAAGAAAPTVSGPTGANDGSLVPVVVPQSDAVINGVGYFSFTPDQFFAPTPYKTLNINDSTDLGLVDYIITDYQPPQQLADGWKSQTLHFNLSDAVVQKGKLSWLISAPGLQENGRSIEIKSISMTLTKKGWFSK